MFEKEAEEIANKKLCSERICYNHCNFNSPKHHRCGEWHRIYECAKESAEFGYNKANEWHFVKDGDLPKHENYVLVSNGKDWTKAFYKDGKWNVISLVGFLHVIAWKEIEVIGAEIMTDEEAHKMTSIVNIVEE